ncbi:MAG TPA: hypothetical protein VFV20_02055, partial [Candidatus Limnocylindria bacterium]|nr:hypothetical protein [Candidatus Limnocylindria bacterium]
QALRRPLRTGGAAATRGMTTIVDLEEQIAGLPAEARAAASRIFTVSTTTGVLDAPPEMHAWIAKLFGSVDAVREQRIVRVTNTVTFEGALFNELRAMRPMEVKGGDEVRQTIESARGDPFDHPETGTPADSFGRIAGKHGLTASNIAKYDGFHGVLVFKEHDPLAPMGPAVLRDHLATARRWGEAALASDPAARYLFVMWNCLWRAGGSIVHGHMQMTATRVAHYPKVEALRRQALAYATSTGHDYFDDLWLVHSALGLGVEVDGARVLASLVPVKEREVLVIGRPGADESSLAPAIVRVLASYRASGVVAYNMGLYLPPLSPDGEDWRRFPPIARLVDRGDPANKTSDIGAMELYAASVIASDPFRLADQLRT